MCLHFPYSIEHGKRSKARGVKETNKDYKMLAKSSHYKVWGNLAERSTCAAGGHETLPPFQPPPLAILGASRPESHRRLPSSSQRSQHPSTLAHHVPGGSSVRTVRRPRRRGTQAPSPAAAPPAPGPRLGAASPPSHPAPCSLRTPPRLIWTFSGRAPQSALARLLTSWAPARRRVSPTPAAAAGEMRGKDAAPRPVQRCTTTSQIPWTSTPAEEKVPELFRQD